MNLDYIKKVLGLEGKKAIVTGGNSGIGKSAAISLANMGADVTIIGRDQASLDETVAELRMINPVCAGYSVDIKNKNEVDAFFDRYYSDNGDKLDILIANAGVCYYIRALETTEEDVDYFFDINYKGTLFCCQQAAKAMKKQYSGNIIIVTSVNALYPLPTEAAYSSTKGALEVLMQCLAVDLGPYNIKVNTLAPGGVYTNIDRGRFGQINKNDIVHHHHGHDHHNHDHEHDQGPRRPNRGLALGRMGEPEDMGDAIACLVSDAFRYMTGSTVLIDGGLKLRNV